MYKADKELTTIVYADGGVAASIVESENDLDICYHYMCAFESEDMAKEFAEASLQVPVFFEKKTMLELAKEFNCGIIWPGLTGIVYIDKDNMAQHLDVDELVRMALNDISSPKKRYGGPMIANNKIQNVEAIDFNRNYYILLSKNGNMMTKRTYTEKGRKQDWILMATSKTALKKYTNAAKISAKGKEIVEDTLSGLLTCFEPGHEFDGVFTGIEYIDEHGSKMIGRKRILRLLDDRAEQIENLYRQMEIYLDARYFVAADKEYGNPIMATIDDREHILVSSRMDVMYRTMEQEGLDMDEVLFTNLMTLREILESGEESGYDGIALCIDDNPDHIAYLNAAEVYNVALDGDGDEETNPNIAHIGSNNEFMMAERFTMMQDDGYVVSSMQDPSTGEVIDVIFMSDNASTLIDSLETTGYVFGDEEATTRPTYEIFAEFRDGQLEECYGIMCFDDDGFYIIPKEVVIDTLEEWEAITDQKSRRVELDFDANYYMAFQDQAPFVFVQQCGVAFVFVAERLEDLQNAIKEIVGYQSNLKYTDEATLGDISEEALREDMGIAVCDRHGVTFIEPNRLSQALYED